MKRLVNILQEKDKLWLGVWLAGLGCLWMWNAFFLNAPAFERLRAASLNTLLVSVLVVVFAFVWGWLSARALHVLDEARWRSPYLLATFVFNLIRSVPQIVGVLIGYVILTLFMQSDILPQQSLQLVWMSLVISIFVFLEVTDLITERIAFYRKSDFFDAMLCCGIREGRIINREILLKNSRAHLLHKLISVFGASIFLLCSVDFIVSVGLSTDVSLSNIPATLGGLLATMDSKQDILAIGTVVFDWRNLGSLFFEHLQGIGTAWTIVFTLLCLYKISNGFVKRHRL
jgi:ABC-type dipeptide/oligopeptide/nickel transport system permease subunit